MINDYEIKIENGKQVLYLYLNFNYEFSSFNFQNKMIDIKDYIKEFINKNKIAFTGTTVALIASGILIGNINLKDDFRYTYIKNIPFNNQIEIVENIKLNEENDIKINDQNENTNIKEEITNNEKISTNNIDSNQNINNLENNYNQETQYYEEENNQFYVTVNRGNGDVINIELENYLIGVVGAEMPASFNIEALKAQAVIARTYALKSISRNQILTDNESTQSYKDDNELKNLWGNNYYVYYDKIKESVDSTRGMYLTYNGTYIDAVYHSTSNTKTEDSINVWGNYYPYLVSVDSPYDSFNPTYLKTVFISYEELSNKIGMEININTEFNIQGYTSGGRVASILISEKQYTGVEFRSLFKLRSADFEIEKLENGINVTTRGYGHGVGMSQYGANGMAKSGYNFIDILKHYYKGVSITSFK
ncbi:MAG: stage II sporulation protein D [Bacilli bacterium]|nr:stage II sporulation protein D [Bacilli bacterium]